MTLKGQLFAMMGKASEAVPMITSGISALRSMGVNVFVPWYLSVVARAYGQLGQFDEARHCIGEAITLIETTKERWCEAEVYRIAGEIALKSPEHDAAKAEMYFEHSPSRADSKQNPGNFAPR